MKEIKQEYSSYDTMSVVTYLLATRKVLSYNCLDILFMIRRFVPAEYTNLVLGQLASLVVANLFRIRRNHDRFSVVMNKELVSEFDSTKRILYAVYKDKALNLLSNFEDVYDHLLVIVSSEIHDLYYSYYKMEA